MKKDKYAIAFLTGQALTIWALNPLEAYIEACKIRIDNGLPYDVQSITNMDNMTSHAIKILITTF
jgi:hypothetical protein